MFYEKCFRLLKKLNASEFTSASTSLVQINNNNQILKEKPALRFFEAVKLTTYVCLVCRNPLFENIWVHPCVATTPRSQTNIWKPFDNLPNTLLIQPPAFLG